MLKTYRGILRGDRIEWQGEAPAEQGPVGVEVTVHTPAPRSRSDGRRMADIAREIAQMGTFAQIEDPVAWQREIRKDRPLPYRDE